MILTEDIREKIKTVLTNDGVIGFVTDTVWGIGCLVEKEQAVKKIYNIKGREQEKPLILMSSDIYPLLNYVESLPKSAHKLIKQYFPGALTVVVLKNQNTPDYITSNLKTVGIRVPDNKVFAEICECVPSKVLATTSANLSHNPPALNYQEAIDYVGSKVDLIIDDYGYNAEGTASTVVGFKDENPVIYRQGNVIID